LLAGLDTYRQYVFDHFDLEDYGKMFTKSEVDDRMSLTLQDKEEPMDFLVTTFHHMMFQWRHLNGFIVKNFNTEYLFEQDGADLLIHIVVSLAVLFLMGF